MSTKAQERSEAGTIATLADHRPSDPIAVAVRLHPPHREGLSERFAATDQPKGHDLTKREIVGRMFASKYFQLVVAGPVTAIFLGIILSGLIGTSDPNLNLTAITWYLWFCLVFVMLVVGGRVWCTMCPFGAIGDFFGRQPLLQKFQKMLHLGRPMPEWLAQYGYLLSIGTFLGLTWIEEYWGIGGPGAPRDTAAVIGGLVIFASFGFLVFERRSYCRYLCPLTALEGSVGAMGAAAGFRTKDREVCLDCTTKDCMRGGEDGHGCPWYTWPGSADSNMSCALCADCYKACPNDNIGFYVQAPLTSVIAPTHRRFDVAVSVMALWGMVVYQQFNATNWYANIDDKLNSWMHFPQYPNPVAYLGVTAVLALVTVVPIWAISRLMANPATTYPSKGPRFLERNNRFRAYLMPISYGLIPVVGADYFARQLPKFFEFITTIVPSIGHLFGHGSADSSLYDHAVLSGDGAAVAQVIVMALGTIASGYVMWRIARRDLAPISKNPTAVKVVSTTFVVVCGVVAAWLYLIIHGAV